MSNYKKHAEREFRALGWTDEDGFKDEMQELMCNQVLELLKVFSSHEHSGTTAPYAVNLFKDLAAFKPLGSLTGNDDEWVDVSKMSGEPLWQNKRCSHVFKGEDGKAYDTQGKVFCDKSGSCYTCNDSHIFISFPYTPKTEYIEVD